MLAVVFIRGGVISLRPLEGEVFVKGRRSLKGGAQSTKYSSSVWKLLVATHVAVCVCVAEGRMCIFNAFIPSTEVFISSAKTFIFSAINLFVFYLESSESI